MTSYLHFEKPGQRSGRGMPMYVAWLGLVLCGQLSCTDSLSGQDKKESDSTLEISFLANEGFLIQKGKLSVLIDAFIKDEYYGYGVLPDKDYEKLIKGQEPFQNIQLALTTHVHLDHFQPATATKFLQSNPNCVFVSTEQVALKIRDGKSEPSVEKQMVSIWPDEGTIKSVQIEGIKLSAFRLRHANPRNYSIQNLGFIIDVGGEKVLHVGDAESKAVNFEQLKLIDKEIDVAILPFWMFSDTKLVSEQIAAKNYIAAHIPAKQTDRVKKQLSKNELNVHVLAKPLEQWKLGGNQQ